MRKPHFFKAKSRLGLIHAPMRHSAINIGVEDGPDAILTEDFLNKFADSAVTDFTFTKPEDIKPNDYYQVLADQLKKFKQNINQSIMTDETQVVIGGDNSVTFSSLLAVMERTDDIATIGYIQFDSHGEMHLFNSSISKNFHGMYMRPLLDEFDIPEIESLVPQKLKLNQVLTFGDIIFDEGDDHPRGEPQFYKNIRNIDREEYRSEEQSVLAETKEFVQKFDHIHLNFDIDVFDASVAGPSAMGDEGIWFWEEVSPLLEIIKTAKTISVDIVEVNPQIKGSEQTITVAQKVLTTILE